MPRLRTTSPCIREDILRALETINIRTVEALVLADPAALLARTTLSRQDLSTLLTSAYECLAPSPIRANVLHARLLESSCTLSLGCEGLDEMLQGGLTTGEVVELVGPPSSGKTQICHHATLTAALEGESSVLFLDTTNSFAPNRLVDMARRPCVPRSNEDDVRLAQALTRIRCVRVFSVFQLLHVLENVFMGLEKQGRDDDFHAMLRLVVIDSVAAVVSPILGSHPYGHALMVQVARIIKAIAIEQDVACLYVNNTVRGDGDPKPALGETWTHTPHTQITLSFDVETHIHQAAITKSSTAPLGIKTFFRISTGGITSVPPSQYTTA